MPECRKYKSVLVAKTHEGFIEALDTALLKKDDPEYLALLKKEALENTWEAKAGVIANLIRANLS